jgi:hypothetical protein
MTVWECYGVGWGDITTRDPLGIQLAWSEAGAYVQVGGDDLSGDWWNGWAWYNELANAPTAAGTNWYWDSPSSYLDVGYAYWGSAWSTFDAYFYNYDFPSWFNRIFGFPILTPQTTTVEHYISTAADTGYGFATAFGAGIDGYAPPWYSFLTFDVSDGNDAYCDDY